MGYKTRRMIPSPAFLKLARRARQVQPKGGLRCNLGLAVHWSAAVPVAMRMCW